MERATNIELLEKVCFELKGQVNALTAKVDSLNHQVVFLKSEVADLRSAAALATLNQFAQPKYKIEGALFRDIDETARDSLGLVSDMKFNERIKTALEESSPEPIDEDTKQLKLALFSGFETMPWDAIKEEFQLDEFGLARFFKTDQVLEVSLGKLKYLSPKDLNAGNIIDEFENLAKYRPENIGVLFNNVKNSFNLISNPCGEAEFKGWTVKNEGGKIIIDRVGTTFKGKEAVFATSFGWGTLEQQIIVPHGAGERVLVVGAFVARRKDCPSRAAVELEMKGEVSRAEALLQDIGGNDDFSDWQMLRVVKKIGRGAEEARVRVKGKDEKYWAGNFGARIGYCFAYCFES